METSYPLAKLHTIVPYRDTQQDQLDIVYSYVAPSAVERQQRGKSSIRVPVSSSGQVDHPFNYDQGGFDTVP
jgi:hypothetical protein